MHAHTNYQDFSKIGICDLSMRLISMKLIITTSKLFALKLLDKQFTCARKGIKYIDMAMLVTRKDIQTQRFEKVLDVLIVQR